MPFFQKRSFTQFHKNKSVEIISFQVITTTKEQVILMSDA